MVEQTKNKKEIRHPQVPFSIFKEFDTFLKYVRRKWGLFVISVIVGIGIGFLIYSTQKPKYKAVTTFILEEKSAGGAGLAGLASQFGLSLGNLNGNASIFTGDNILSILESKKVVQSVLLTGTETGQGKTLADAYLNFSGLAKKWEDKPRLAGISFDSAGKPLSPLEDSVLDVIYTRIITKNLFTEKTTRQGTIYRVQVTAEDNSFARILSGRLVSEASKLYLDLRIGTAQKNINDLQKRADSLLILLNNKSYSVAASQPLDINPGIHTAGVPMEIANRDKTVLATLYAEVVKNLEASKMLLSQETPVIEQLDKPSYLLDDNKKGLFFLLVASTLTTVLIFLMSLFLIFLYRRFGIDEQEKSVEPIINEN